jgi:hypothetical protein
MIYFSIFLAIFSIGFCIFILSKFNSLKREFRGTITREIKDSYVVLPKLKELPNYNDVDPNNKTLRDILKSMDIENWTLDNYKREYEGYSYSYLYEFYFSNPQKSLRITTRLRNNDDDLRLVGFHVKSDTGTISYDETESNKDVSILIKEYLWKIVCDKNQDEYDEQFSHYQTIKNTIDKELKTLRREETLLNILGNEQR